jgi:hypothetical protein
VHKPNGDVRVFQESTRGLYYMDTVETGTLLINTVEDNRSSYTNRAYSRALLAQRIQKTIGRPSLRTFLNIVDNNLLQNCPVTRKDIMAAEDIFGPDIGSLKGKTVRSASVPVDIRIENLPATVMLRYKEVTLCGDIMFVNKTPFLVTISRDIKFGTVEMILNQKGIRPL